MTMMMTRGRADGAGRRFGEGLLEDEPLAAGARIEETSNVEATPAQPARKPRKARKAAQVEGEGAGPDGQLSVSQFDIARHDAIVTIHNPATGQHRTFKVETLRGDWNPGKRVVALLDGPDNTADYRRFAFVEGGAVKVWRRLRSDDPTAGEPSVWEKFARMLEAPAKFEARGLEYMISAVCRRCHRHLTTPRSVSLGIGPTCEGKE